MGMIAENRRVSGGELLQQVEALVQAVLHLRVRLRWENAPCCFSEQCWIVRVFLGLEGSNI
jgi:DNA relaxase NicK